MICFWLIGFYILFSCIDWEWDKMFMGIRHRWQMKTQTVQRKHRYRRINWIDEEEPMERTA